MPLMVDARVFSHVISNILVLVFLSEPQATGKAELSYSEEGGELEVKFKFDGLNDLSCLDFLLFKSDAHQRLLFRVFRSFISEFILLKNVSVEAEEKQFILKFHV